MGQVSASTDNDRRNGGKMMHTLATDRSQTLADWKSETGLNLR